MKRKLFFLERVLYGDGTAPFNGVFALKIIGALKAERLIDALERVQAKQALLRARVETDEKGMHWFVEHEGTPPIPLRTIVRRADGDWITESRRELATAFDTGKGPLLRVVWLNGGEVSELILAFHHCLCDGGSALALMRDILLLLDKEGADIGEGEAWVTMNELLSTRGTGESRSDRDRMERKAKGISALLRVGLSLGALLTPTKGKTRIARSDDYLLHWKLDRELSAALLRYCKSIPITVNTLLCVAALYAFRSVKGDRARQKMTCPVDIRRYHPAIKKDRLFAFGLAVSLSLKKKRSDDFPALLREAQQLMTGKLSKLNAIEFLLTMEFSHAALENMIKVLTYGKQGDDLMFSNMGKLDIPDSYSSFRVDTVYSPTVIGPFGNPTTLITTTYKGQLDFSFVSNQAVLPLEEAQAIRDKMIKVLEGVAEPVLLEETNYTL
jgi:NRPS condensation-like uncharacterized protein